MNLSKLLEINANDEWILKACKNLHDYMNPPTAWDIDDKSDYLNVNSDGLSVDYTGELYYNFIWNFTIINIKYTRKFI
jgi:hypothetical protein